MDLSGFAWIWHGFGMDLVMFGTVEVARGRIWSHDFGLRLLPVKMVWRYSGHGQGQNC